MWWMTVMHLYSEFRKRNIFGIDKGFHPTNEEGGNTLCLAGNYWPPRSWWKIDQICASFGIKNIVSQLFSDCFEERNWLSVILFLRFAFSLTHFCQITFYHELVWFAFFVLCSLLFVVAVAVAIAVAELLLLQRQLQALIARLFRSSGSSRICLQDFHL